MREYTKRLMGRQQGDGLGRHGAAKWWALALVFTAGAVGAALLTANIGKRQREATVTTQQVVKLTERTIDPAEWGKNFPRQYDGYIRTVNNSAARFRWSEGRPPEHGDGDMANAPMPAQGPVAGDPFSKKTESKLESDPHLKTIFNGYAFALDYRERRGHAFMLHDQRETERVKQRNQPGACLNCHSSTVVAHREAGIKAGAPGSLDDPLSSAHGQEQLLKGFHAVNPMKYVDATQLVEHPVTCLDCHDPVSMKLRITRPAFMEGIANLAKSKDPVPHMPSIEQWRKGPQTSDYNPNDLASRQEMRSMSCAQCHVEYYFKGDAKALTFPWHNGLKMEQIEDYYDQVKWNDWKHKDSGAQVIKAQHPEFELWSQGIHARAGVSCADCHMPYKREGAMKFTDHQVQTPMANVAASCQTCHNYTESEIQARVDTIQKRTKAQLDRTEKAVVELINAIKAAKAAGATDEALAPAFAMQRKAQWRADYINAENSMGFHAPQETMRILAEGVDYARQGIIEVMKLSPGSGTAPAKAAEAPVAEPAKAAEKPVSMSR
jgi:nitrite reductase (cytochrome c-552)